LELGIDIGTVDKIVQIDSTHSVSSLVQRIGRSGRREGERSIANIYATDKWSLLQSLACWKLYKDEFIEPVITAKKPFDILLHQMLSIAKQLSGCKRINLINRLKKNPTFESIPENEINNLIEESVKSDYLEIIEHELILGVEGEKIVNSREFYSVFKTEQNFKVIHSGKTIGDIPFSPQVKIDENLLLAARIWKIIDIDFNGLKIIVIPAKDGKKPIFFGIGGNIHPRIREEMLRILKSNELYGEFDETSNLVLNELRWDFRNFEINDLVYDKPVIKSENRLLLYTFTGTKINKSLSFLFNQTCCEAHLDEHSSSFEIEIKETEFTSLVEQVNQIYSRINDLLITELKENKSLIGFSKWGTYLPVEYQSQIVKERYFDFAAAIALINNVRLIEST